MRNTTGGAARNGREKTALIATRRENDEWQHRQGGHHRRGHEGDWDEGDL